MNSDLIESSARTLKVAVVGAGPSGFYAIQALYKWKDCPVQVDLFDRLPTPFGLVRGGVAPDHQKIKGVVRIYETLARDERTRFFGHVRLGQDVMMHELLEYYDAVVLATGNESDRRLGIPGEDLDGVFSATEFVGWYNGHPDFQNRDFKLDTAGRALVVGNGNVAMDVARILVRSVKDLASTDITSEAIHALQNSTIREVVLLGRRGPAQAAFSPKEIKELGGVDGCTLVLDPSDLEFSEDIENWLSDVGGSDAHRNVEYLREVAGAGDTGTLNRAVRCSFLGSPTRFEGSEAGVDRVIIERNELYFDDRGQPRPRGTGIEETIEAQLVFKAIGYRGTPIQGVPFCERRGIIPNIDGRVLTHDDGEPIQRLYVAGWAKRGPTGLIGTNNADAKATILCLMDDWNGGKLKGPKSNDDITDILSARDVDYVTWQDWENLDAREKELGEAEGKIREKLTSVEEMMSAIRRARQTT